MVDRIVVSREGSREYSLDWLLLPRLRVLKVTVEFDCAMVVTLGKGRARVVFEQSVVHPIFVLEVVGGVCYRVAERRIDLDGSPNFRDLGDYINEQGCQVRWGSLYRSGRLSALSRRDVDSLEALGIGLVCDFRQPEEAKVAPSRLPSGDVKVLALSIDPGNVMDFFARVLAGKVDEGQVSEFMLALNDELVLEHSYRYRQMFEALLNSNGRSLLIHCTAGKDRTGFGAKLLLSALGVGRERIMADYLLTNDYLPVDQEIAAVLAHYGSRAEPALLRPLLEVRPSYLQRAFAAIDEHFGSVEGYLHEQIGLSAEDVMVLRERYLYSSAGC